MKISFYIKLFIAFIVFAILLLGFSSFSFNNFYKFHNEKKEKEHISNILNYQEDLFKLYLKSYDEKLMLVQSSISKMQNNYEIINFVEKTLFSDKNILSFEIVAFDSKEKLKIKNISIGIKVTKDEKLKYTFTNPYFNHIRVLKENEIYHYAFDKDGSFVIDLIIRNKNDFYILKIDLEENFNNIHNKFSNKTYVSKINESKGNDYFSKKININNEQYFFYIIKYEDIKNDYIKDYYKSIIIIGFCLALILSLLFSEPIAKLNNKVEEENKKLDLSNKKNFLELNENQKVIDKHIMFLRLNNNIITDVSDALCYFLGYSKGELIGHSYDILIQKDMKRKVQKNIFKHKKESSSYVREIKGNKKDGELFWIDLYVDLIFKNKKIIGYTIICSDITNKKKIEDLYVDLSNQVEEYNAIFDNVNSGISLIDSKGNFVKFNSTFSKLLGYDGNELLNINCMNIISDKSKKLFEKILSEVKEIGNISNLEKIFIKKDGNFIHLEFSLSILSLDKEHLVFVVNSLEDKRKLQELNQHLAEKINQEVEKNIQKDRLHQQEQIKNAKLTSIGSLAAGIAHEINTPLTYIKGNLELMHYDILDLPQNEITNRMKYDSEKMKEGINRIANIVESMREISQSSKEIKEKINIYATLITSLTMAYNRSRQVSRIFINEKLFNIDSINKNEFFYCSKVQKQRLEQVWIIVINNALDELIKIQDYESRALNILLFEDNNEIVVKFKDSAGGINEEIIDDIFEPFVSSKEHSGMGVGLNIAKRIVDEQDGVIKAYNEDNGAVFEIRLKKCEEE